MMEDTRFCFYCNYAITGMEFRQAVISFPCPDCGHISGNHMAANFYQYGSMIHCTKWEEWKKLPEAKRVGRGPLPFPYRPDELVTQ